MVWLSCPQWMRRGQLWAVRGLLRRLLLSVLQRPSLPCGQGRRRSILQVLRRTARLQQGMLCMCLLRAMASKFNLGPLPRRRL